MPYIKPEDRDKYDAILGSISDILMDLPPEKVSGELNYLIFSIIANHIELVGLNYNLAQNLIGGTLTCCQLELYRRLLTPYEDEKKVVNGDVLFHEEL